MTENGFAKLIAFCDLDIRAGRLADVPKRLQRLNVTKIPREYRLPLATICRRASLYPLGLKILTNLVYPRNNVEPYPATHPELAEYAALLQRYGALGEALEILERVDPTEAPDSLLYRAFAFFSLWDYAQAIPFLEQYIRTQKDPYWHLIGQVNQGFALAMAGQNHDASLVLEDSILRAKEFGFQKLQSNCHSFRARAYINVGQFKDAQTEINLANGILGEISGRDSALVFRMQCLLTGLSTNDPRPLLELQERSISVHDWEAARETDLYLLKLNFDEGRFHHLIFGSPYEKFRSLACRVLQRTTSREVYVLGPKNSPRFDLSSGKIDGVEPLSEGRKCHQLIEVLLRDFYRPVRIPGIFSGIYPNEYYDIFSSRDRVHQLIRRARRWIENEKIPIEISEAKEFYRLSINGPFSFRLSLERGPVESLSVHYLKLKKVFVGQETFSAREAREKLGLSRRTIQRLVNWGVENGQLRKIGSRNSTLYSLPQRESTASGSQAA